MTDKNRGEERNDESENEKSGSSEKEYNKLVRDRIPEIIEKNGEKPITRRAEGNELGILLAEKLVEEAEEYKEEREPEELADVLEVVYALCDFEDIEVREIEQKRHRKARERGAFKEGIVLERVEESG